MVEKTKGKKRKVLVTGSSGMLGTDLCRELANEYEVVGLDARSPGSQVPMSPDTFIQSDITDKNKIIRDIVNAKPDLIVHAAAWTDVDECEKDPEKTKTINEIGTENVVLAASKLGVPLMYISTDFVFDGNKKNPYTEEDKPNPLNVYARSKLKSEKETSKLTKHIILRTSWMFGKNGENFVSAILNQAKSEKEIKVVNDQVGSPTYTKDLARAIGVLINDIRHTTYDIRDIYHVTNNGAVSWFDYAKEILKLTEVSNVKLTPIKASELGRPAKRPAYSVLDNSKFEKETGYVMRPWQEALKEYLQHR